MVTFVDQRKDYGEDRWIGIGLLRGIAVVVVFTERGQDTIRVISARKATRQEERIYAKEIRD